MAADNAIIIGLIAANFAPKNRKQIIMYGVFAAFIFRIMFALSATYLFKFAIIKIVGGALLIWIVNDLRQDLFGKKKKIKSPTKVSKEPSFMQGMYKVIIADITSDGILFLFLPIVEESKILLVAPTHNKSSIFIINAS